jgi:AhpD family alkylhydroperoxidase
MATHDHLERRREIRAGYRALADVLPAHMQALGDLHEAATADGALSQSAKELMALAISICVQCGDCITVHLHAALRAGASPAQVHETIGLAMLMGGGPASTYAVVALDALQQFLPTFDSGGDDHGTI